MVAERAEFVEDELAFVHRRRRSSRTSRGCGGRGLALIEAIRGDRAAAAQHLALAGMPADLHRDVNWPSAMWEQGAAAMLLGDVERAREVAETCSPRSPRRR